MSLISHLTAIAMRELDDRTISSGEAHDLLDIIEAAQNVRDGFPFLMGTPGEDFGGAWVPFVETLSRVGNSQSVPRP